MLSITVSSMVEPFELTTLQSNVHEAAVVAAVTEVVLGAAVSAVGTELGASMLGATVLEAGLQEVPPAIWTPFSAGLAAGGLTPLLVSGAFRSGVGLWFVQLGVVLLWFSVLC